VLVRAIANEVKHFLIETQVLVIEMEYSMKRMQIMLTTKTCCVLLTGAHLCKEGLGPAQFLMLVSVTCQGSCQCHHISQPAETMSQYYPLRDAAVCSYANFRKNTTTYCWGLWTQIQSLVHQPHFATAIKASAA